uniref:Phospholipase A2 n=1 Tax=Glossina austeni TaxID=7395 RepID=A0A1A9UHU7_GLOAU
MDMYSVSGLKRSIQLICLLAIVVTGFLNSAGAKPTLTFSLPQSLQGFPTLTSFTQQIFENRNARQVKTYSGQRLSNNSLIMIYYHDTTIAVTELGARKLLLGCELIEIYNDQEGVVLLRDLSKYNRPLEIRFDEMIKLMNQCERVDKLIFAAREKSRKPINNPNDGNENIAFNLGTIIFPKNPLSILSGIIPGTKWCGTGDIADTYNDLGTETNMDRCCRQHDLCPLKIRAYQSKYGLTNDSLYTKSHCTCDDMLFSCLKRTNTSASQLMGSIYFNLVQVPCLARANNRYQYRPAKEGF